MLAFNFARSAFRAEFVALLGLTVALAACSEREPTAVEPSEPSFWEERDDFSQMDASYLDAKIWIDQESGHYLDLQFQCFRHVGAKIAIEKNLIIASETDAEHSGGFSRTLDAVLFKSEGESASIYRQRYGGEVLSGFLNATVDLDQVLRLDPNENYRSVEFRFVYGASPAMAQFGDLAALSRAESVDFELSADGSETGKFLRACAPVKNWTPPE
jgi:hypothetical protein